MTASRGAGQTLNKVVADLREEPFAHGLLYITLSRIKCSEDILLLVNEETANKNAIVKNLVYNDLLTLGNAQYVLE